MILVTAANGNQGKLLVPRLLSAGFRIRACVRTETSASALRANGVDDIVCGDINDPDVLDRAMSGVEKVYHVGPTAHPKEREMGFAVIDAARRHGVNHFVYSSVLHAIITDLVQHEIKRDVEEHLLSSDLEFTILQPTNYMAPNKLIPVFKDGVFRLSWSLERRQSLVDLVDVIEVAAMVLADTKRHSGATYELVAPGRFTAPELAAILSNVLGRNIAAEEIDADTYLESMFGKGGAERMPHEASVLRSITKRYSAHDFVGNSNVLTWLLGRSPTTFEEFARRHHAQFLANQEISFSAAR